MEVRWNFGTRWGALLICKAIQQTNIKTWKIIQAAEKTLTITDEDVKRLKIKHDKRMIWDTAAGEQKESFNIDEQFMKFLREQIKILDQKNMIPSDLLPLAEELKAD